MSDRQSNTVEDTKQEEEEADNGAVLAGLTLGESSLPPASADLEGERSDPQGALSPQASSGLPPGHTDRREERSEGDQSTGETDTTVDVVTMTPGRRTVDLESGVPRFEDQVESRRASEGDSQRPGGGEERGEGGSANRWITTSSPERHCCAEESCCLSTSYTDTTPPSGPAGGSTSAGVAKTRCEQVGMKNSLDVDNSNEEEHCERDPPQGRDPGSAEEVDSVSKLRKETQSTPPPEARDPCEEPKETLCGAGVSDDETQRVEDLGQGDVTAQRLEGGGPGREREETEERESEQTQAGLDEGYRTEDRGIEASKDETDEGNSEEDSPGDVKEKGSEEEYRTGGKAEKDEFAKAHESREEDRAEENRTDELDEGPQEEVVTEVVKSRPERIEGEYSKEKLEGEIKKECRAEESCISAPPDALTEEIACRGGGGRSEGEREKDSGRCCNSPSLVPATAPATSVTHKPSNPAPLAAMATGLPDPKGAREAGGGASAELQSPRKQELGQERGPELGSKVASLGGSVEEGQKEEEEEEEEEEDDDFGLFMQAGEQPSWEDSFASSPPVPCGNRESVALENHLISDESAHWTSGWTDSLFHQSEETWTAFPKDPVKEGRDVAGQWWPSCVEEETRDRHPAKQDLNTVFTEAFHCLLPSSPAETEVIPTLTQVLRGAPDQHNPAEDHGLLDGFHDLNKMIGWRYKSVNAVSCERLLQSLHLDRSDSDDISRPRTTNHSPSLGHNSSNQHATGKRRLSYDLNKNIME